MIDTESPAATDLLQALAPHPLVAILRAPDASRFLSASEILYAAGFRCVEFTLTTQGALDAIAAVGAALPDDLIIGVGTVRTPDQVEAAIDAGAAFCVSQIFRDPLVAAAHARGVPFFPGALTPTEIVAAWESGVAAVKVSPIGPVGGLDYFANVRGPLPEIPLMPTGGVGIDEIADYLRQGAVAVGLSGALFGDALLPAGALEGLADRAKRAVAEMRSVQGDRRRS